MTTHLALAPSRPGARTPAASGGNWWDARHAPTPPLSGAV